jgi:hypothetical protein
VYRSIYLVVGCEISARSPKRGDDTQSIIRY